jgi:hypothetical protein
VENQIKKDKIFVMSSFEEESKCGLCDHSAAKFWFDDKNDRAYYKCSKCLSISCSKISFLPEAEEKERYLHHENDIYNIEYQNFVSPITDAVLKSFNPKTDIGLDYGCGTGPVISYLLEKNGFEIIKYDPFFYPSQSYLQKTYNFIACCEVMEHFHNPKTEFDKLSKLLKPGGKLFCKTALISNDISTKEFSKWYYKNDPTHVFFYSFKGLEFIKETYQFRDLIITEKLITFIV